MRGQEKGHMAGNRSLRKVRCGRRAAIGVQRDEARVLVEPHVPEICVREVVARLLFWLLMVNATWIEIVLIPWIEIELVF